MKIIDKKGVSGIVEWMVTFIMLGGILIWISLPWSVTWLMPRIKPYYAYDDFFRWFILVLLFVTGALAIWIVYEIRRFFISINNKNPFIYSNVTVLKRIAISSFIIALAYIVKIVYFPTVLTIVVTMIFIIAGFFCIVLAEVFRQAVDVKQENDLTI